jgi:hypothetical protein
MILDLCPEAVEFGRLAHQALAAAGGDALVQAAEVDPDNRAAVLRPLLDELGVEDLDPSGGGEEMEAAAALCRSFGYWAVPYPIAEVLSRPADLDVDGLSVVSELAPAAPIVGLDLRWAGVTLDGRRSLARPVPSVEAPRRVALVAEVDLDYVDDGGASQLPLALVLPCWTLLGMLDRALELTLAHTRQRQQFGQPLFAFQGVQFQLTDAEVERVGVEELAKYALWSVQSARAGVGDGAGHGAGRWDEAIDDALALRLAAIEAADVVFRVAHQLHGANGFCDETTLSWLSRYSVPLRRLPFALSETRARLTRRAGSAGLAGLFEDGAL